MSRYQNIRASDEAVNQVLLYKKWNTIQDLYTENKFKELNLYWKRNLLDIWLLLVEACLDIQLLALLKILLYT